MRIRICNTTVPYFFTYSYSIFRFPEVFLLNVKFLERICKMVSMWPSQMLSTCLIKKRLALIHPLLELVSSFLFPKCRILMFFPAILMFFYLFCLQFKVNIYFYFIFFNVAYRTHISWLPIQSPLVCTVMPDQTGRRVNFLALVHFSVS
jgi:hypothetical protein